MHPFAPFFPVFMILIIAVANMRRRRVFEAFRKAEATSQERAKSLTELGLTRSLFFRQEVGHKVIVASMEEKYYLDEARLEERLHARRWVAFWVVAGLLSLTVIFYMASL